MKTYNIKYFNNHCEPVLNDIGCFTQLQAEFSEHALYRILYKDKQLSAISRIHSNVDICNNAWKKWHKNNTKHRNQIHVSPIAYDEKINNSRLLYFHLYTKETQYESGKENEYIKKYEDWDICTTPNSSWFIFPLDHTDKHLQILNCLEKYIQNNYSLITALDDIKHQQKIYKPCFTISIPITSFNGTLFEPHITIHECFLICNNDRFINGTKIIPDIEDECIVRNIKNLTCPSHLSNIQSIRSIHTYIYTQNTPITLYNHDFQEQIVVHPTPKNKIKNFFQYVFECCRCTRI